MHRLHHPDEESGFTLVEVLVAIMILLIGVLGVVAMVDGANAITGKTKAREGANNVARSAIEVGRAVPYKILSDDALFAAFASRPGLADVSASPGYTIASRGFEYDVTLLVCSMDDPKDGVGAHDGTIEFCPDSDVGSGSGSGIDRNPDDYKRIAVTLTWKRGGGTERVKQTSLISNPVGGLGPTVIRLDTAPPSGTPTLVTSGTSVDFVAETSTDASELDWSVDGAAQGAAKTIGASLRKFGFTWKFDGGGGGRYYDDCTYVIQAEAFDDKGRAGSPKALTVILNRAVARAPLQFEGGRNGNKDFVDLRWKASPECDVLGYRVYRSTGSSSGPWTQVNCSGQVGTYVTVSNCLDENAPGTDPLWYAVAAVDTDPVNGALRPGLQSVLTVPTGNTLPTKPTNLSACLGGTSGCTEPDGSSASDGATVIRWDPSTDSDPSDSVYFYRIYRDGDTYTQRFSVFFPDGAGVLAWTDPETPDGKSHTYKLTAVDSHLGESPLSDAVVFP
jgi:prepilin-type N-terminal cleavage/methylation domain-containing protein